MLKTSSRENNFQSFVHVSDDEDVLARFDVMEFNGGEVRDDGLDFVDGSSSEINIGSIIIDSADQVRSESVSRILSVESGPVSDEVVNASGINEVFIVMNDGSVASSLFFTVVEDGEELGV